MLHWSNQQKKAQTAKRSGLFRVAGNEIQDLVDALVHNVQRHGGRMGHAATGRRDGDGAVSESRISADPDGHG